MDIINLSHPIHSCCSYCDGLSKILNGEIQIIVCYRAASDQPATHVMLT